ncbi:MAG: DinB family protein [Armatimonadota bacterium]|nr:DinB family protein [Armatimonadota bacterium]MDR7506434.1 DinB family protein [Armatimonadota bacterium]MDR7508989.1 DinB family protein [Armatimonadota bacterium]MDR7560942.1 DinB family protein [Armatimonadota bacterium]MDR7582512.1 DinB family protein [Armatimonadota bacterium]
MERVDHIVSWVVDRCDQTYRAGNWAGRGVQAAVADLGPQEAHWRPHPDQHTIAEIILHMAYWKDAVAARLSGAEWAYEETQDWRQVEPTAAGLAAALAELAAAHGRLMAQLRMLTAARLLDPVGNAWWSPSGRALLIDLVVDVATHDSYHAAQIFVLRRLHAGRPPA